MSVLGPIEVLMAKGDLMIEQEMKKMEELWNQSILKWRGVSLDDFRKIYYSQSSVAIFDVGAEVFFMNNNRCVCDKIKSINIYIKDGMSVRYSVESIKDRRLDSDFVFASMEELKEHLRLGIVNPKGYGKGYGGSDFKTSVEDLQRSGYSIKHFDLLGVGRRIWIMHDNHCEEKPIYRTNIEINESEYNISYTLEFWNGYKSEYVDYPADKIFTTKEELLETIQIEKC